LKKKRPLKSNWAKIEAFSVLAALGIVPLSAQTLETAYRKEGEIVRDSFSKVTEVFQESSAVFYDDWEASQYGIIISADGEILVKASELEAMEEPFVVIGKKSYRDFSVLASNPVWDVALVKVDAQGLTPIEFADFEPPHGSIVISNAGTGRFSRRGQMGIISAHARAVGDEGLAVLGIAFSPVSDEEVGIQITEVFDNGGAAKAGVKAEDILLSVEGQKIENPDDLLAMMEGKIPGDVLTLSLLREPEKSEVPIEIEDPFAELPAKESAEPLTLEVELSERQNVLEAELTRNDYMSGEFSKRRSFFPRILQHDTSLANRTTGGPLLNLDGQCLGMNIAYASREASYAIPAKELQQVIANLRDESGR
jgi:serine protease Do